MSTKVFGNMCAVASIDGVDYLYSFLGLTDASASASTQASGGYAILDNMTGEPGAWVGVDPLDFGFDLVGESFTWARGNRQFAVVKDADADTRFIIAIPGTDKVLITKKVGANGAVSDTASLLTLPVLNNSGIFGYTFNGRYRLIFPSRTNNTSYQAEYDPTTNTIGTWSATTTLNNNNIIIEAFDFDYTTNNLYGVSSFHSGRIFSFNLDQTTGELLSYNSTSQANPNIFAGDENSDVNFLVAIDNVNNKGGFYFPGGMTRLNASRPLALGASPNGGSASDSIFNEVIFHAASFANVNTKFLVNDSDLLGTETYTMDKLNARCGLAKLTKAVDDVHFYMVGGLNADSSSDNVVSVRDNVFHIRPFYHKGLTNNSISVPLSYMTSIGVGNTQPRRHYRQPLTAMVKGSSSTYLYLISNHGALVHSLDSTTFAEISRTEFFSSTNDPNGLFDKSFTGQSYIINNTKASTLVDSSDGIHLVYPVSNSNGSANSRVVLTGALSSVSGAPVSSAQLFGVPSGATGSFQTGFEVYTGAGGKQFIAGIVGQQSFSINPTNGIINGASTPFHIAVYEYNASNNTLVNGVSIPVQIPYMPASQALAVYGSHGYLLSVTGGYLNSKSKLYKYDINQNTGVWTNRQFVGFVPDFGPFSLNMMVIETSSAPYLYINGNIIQQLNQTNISTHLSRIEKTNVWARIELNPSTGMAASSTEDSLLRDLKMVCKAGLNTLNHNNNSLIARDDFTRSIIKYQTENETYLVMPHCGSSSSSVSGNLDFASAPDSSPEYQSFNGSTSIFPAPPKLLMQKITEAGA